MYFRWLDYVRRFRHIGKVLYLDNRSVYMNMKQKPSRKEFLLITGKKFMRKDFLCQGQQVEILKIVLAFGKLYDERTLF